MIKPSKQFWLVKLDRHGNPTLSDGPHEDREGAEHALCLYKALSCIITEGLTFAIAEITITEPTGETDVPINQESVSILNRTMR